MRNRITHRRAQRSAWFACTALAAPFIFAAAASAQTTPPPAGAEAQSTGIQEIVVTAQKRAQNQQDVPISLTAVTPQALSTNRILSVVDLNAIVPNLAVRPTAGGGQLPAFTM